MKGVLLLLALVVVAVHTEPRVEDEEFESINKDSVKGVVQGDDDDDNFGGIGGGGIGGGGIGGGGIGGGGIGGGGDDDDDDDNGSGTAPPPQYCVARYRQCMMFAFTWNAQQVCRNQYYQCVRIVTHPCYRQRSVCLRNAGWNYYKRYWCEVGYKQCLAGGNRPQ